MSLVLQQTNCSLTAGFPRHLHWGYFGEKENFVNPPIYIQKTSKILSYSEVFGFIYKKKTKITKPLNLSLQLSSAGHHCSMQMIILKVMLLCLCV